MISLHADHDSAYERRAPIQAEAEPWMVTSACSSNVMAGYEMIPMRSTPALRATSIASTTVP